VPEAIAVRLGAGEGSGRGRCWVGNAHDLVDAAK
jgi:hypothetical protein